MNVSESHHEQKELAKAKILNRLIAKAIDFILVGILLEMIPKIGFFAGLVYLLISDGLFEGRSIGKRLIKLKTVLYEKDQPCGFRESIIRNFPFAAGYILMAVPIIGFIFPLLVIAFEGLLVLGSEKGLRLGDELAKTQVIEESPAALENQIET
jgi:uncharacterized RDD family membrane protein YckC